MEGGWRVGGRRMEGRWREDREDRGRTDDGGWTEGGRKKKRHKPRVIGIKKKPETPQKTKNRKEVHKQ
jgi:hypothetical protein